MKFGTLTHDGRPHADLQVRASTTSPEPTARRRPSCPSRSTATTARACMCTSRSGRAASRCSPATSMPTCRRRASTTSAASSSMPRRSTPSPTRSTNSYKRLVPGFEAPVLLAYSARNRSASCRIPVTTSPKAKRVEVRFPDPRANPYLAFAAMLMAGLDGIQNKIHPGEAMDKDLYDLPPKELKKIPTVCGSLREALDNLDKDRDFLKKGGVFNDDLIDSLHRAEDGGGDALRDDAAPGRVRHVLLLLSSREVPAPAGTARAHDGAPSGAPFAFGEPLWPWRECNLGDVARQRRGRQDYGSCPKGSRLMSVLSRSWTSHAVRAACAVIPCAARLGRGPLCQPRGWGLGGQANGCRSDEFPGA